MTAPISNGSNKQPLAKSKSLPSATQSPSSPFTNSSITPQTRKSRSKSFESALAIFTKKKESPTQKSLHSISPIERRKFDFKEIKDKFATPPTSPSVNAETQPLPIPCKDEVVSPSSLSTSTPTPKYPDIKPPPNRTKSLGQLSRKPSISLPKEEVEKITINLFSPTQTPITFSLANQLPVREEVAIKHIQKWIGWKDPKKGAGNIVATLLSQPYKEPLFLKVFESEYVNALKSSNQESFYKLLIHISAYEHIALQHLISKFFKSHFEAAANKANSELKNNKFRKLEPIDDARERDNFTLMLFNKYETKGFFLQLLSAIFEADIKNASETNFLSTNSLSESLASIGFTQYLNGLLQIISLQLKKLLDEPDTQNQIAGLIQCEKMLLESLKKEKSIKTISQSVGQKIQAKFPKSTKKKELTQIALADLIFLKAICPYFLRQNVGFGSVFVKLLKALVHDQEHVFELNSKNENDDIPTLTNSAYIQHKVILRKLFEELFSYND